jgi:hypothetical protein
VGKGVLNDGVDVGMADERLMRPVVGIAGPSCHLVCFVGSTYNAMLLYRAS